MVNLTVILLVVVFIAVGADTTKVPSQGVKSSMEVKIKPKIITSWSKIKDMFS